MRPIQPYGTDAKLGQTRLGLAPKTGAETRPSHPRNTESAKPVFTDWAML